MNDRSSFHGNTPGHEKGREEEKKSEKKEEAGTRPKEAAGSGWRPLRKPLLKRIYAIKATALREILGTKDIKERALIKEPEDKEEHEEHEDKEHEDGRRSIYEEYSADIKATARSDVLSGKKTWQEAERQRRKTSEEEDIRLIS